VLHQLSAAASSGLVLLAALNSEVLEEDRPDAGGRLEDEDAERADGEAEVAGADARWEGGRNETWRRLLGPDLDREARRRNGTHRWESRATWRRGGTLPPKAGTNRSPWGGTTESPTALSEPSPASARAGWNVDLLSSLVAVDARSSPVVVERRVLWDPAGNATVELLANPACRWTGDRWPGLGTAAPVCS